MKKKLKKKITLSDADVILKLSKPGPYIEKVYVSRDGVAPSNWCEKPAKPSPPATLTPEQAEDVFLFVQKNIKIEPYTKDARKDTWGRERDLPWQNVTEEKVGGYTNYSNDSYTNYAYQSKPYYPSNAVSGSISSSQIGQFHIASG